MLASNALDLEHTGGSPHSFLVDPTPRQFGLGAFSFLKMSLGKVRTLGYLQHLATTTLVGYIRLSDRAGHSDLVERNTLVLSLPEGITSL